MADDKNAPAQLDEALVKQLLDNLETNDDFRKQFQASPEAALRSLGYAGPMGCLSLKSGELASPKQIKMQRAKLEGAMVGIQHADCPLDAQAPL
ncbi:MAG: NHLP-related RiPP peptide [Thermomonas sp.]